MGNDGEAGHGLALLVLERKVPVGRVPEDGGLPLGVRVPQHPPSERGAQLAEAAVRGEVDRDAGLTRA